MRVRDLVAGLAKKDFATRCVGSGGAIDPACVHDDGAGFFGQTAFVAQELAGEHVDGAGTDAGCVLINAGKGAVGGREVERGEGHVCGDPAAAGAQPLQDVKIGRDDGIGTSGVEPANEGAGFKFGRAVEEGGIGDAFFVRLPKVTGGPETLDTAVVVGADGETNAAAAASAEVGDSDTGGGAVVVGRAVKAGLDESVGDGGGGDVVPGEFERARMRPRGDKGAGNAAGEQNVAKAAGAATGVAEPEMFEAVAGGVGPGFGAGVAAGEEWLLFPSEAGGMGGDPRQRDAIGGGLAGADGAHGFREQGIGTPAELVGDLVNTRASSGGDARMVTQSHGYGGARDGGGGGNLAKGRSVGVTTHEWAEEAGGIVLVKCRVILAVCEQCSTLNIQPVFE